MARIQPRWLVSFTSALSTAFSRLDFSLHPRRTLQRLAHYPFTIADTVYLFHLALAVFWLSLMQSPPFPHKLLIPILYSIALLVPLTSQFFVPATPVFAWLLSFYSSRFIPESWRPRISVSTLPTLETVLYGANISDILTRYTHTFLDILAWIPYGVVHFVAPFIVAFSLWIYVPKPALRLWATTFGYMNFLGVWCQILFPCAAPWYELIHGLTPANYSMKGSPGGLSRIDAIFHSQTYTIGFSNAPVVFGAFPSLHSACATIEALFVSHYFPQLRPYAWIYCAVLYWATMYLTHHYLIDVVGGACLAVASFYYFMPLDVSISRPQATKYQIYGLGTPSQNTAFEMDSDLESDSDQRDDVPFRSPHPPVTPAPNSATPMIAANVATNPSAHRHTASIASFIGPESRVEGGLNPIGTRGFDQS